jgi:hypothetical protein
LFLSLRRAIQKNSPWFDGITQAEATKASSFPPASTASSRSVSPPGRCLLLVSTLSTQTQNRHFDRSCSQPHREQRSGEIRFSTPALSQPQRLGFLLITRTLSSQTSFAVAVLVVLSQAIQTSMSF